MKIAMLAPPYLPVPPLKYGGTEKIVSLLTEGLVARGHDVTLFASGDSTTTAKLSSIFPKAIGNSGLTKGDISKPLAHYHACYARADEFDVIHSHGQFLSLPEAASLLEIPRQGFDGELSRTARDDTMGKKIPPIVFTWHGTFYKGENTEEKRELLRKYKHLNYISISDNQREGLPELHYVATVYNAIDISLYPYVHVNKGDYLLWVGRVSPKKGAKEAIEVAKRVGLRLEMAAAIDPIDRPYFDAEIKPLIDGAHVIYHGEVGREALVELYGGAKATLYPITWHEPFGLVMAESLSCGTPVIAYNIGSVSEIVRDGLNGFVIDPSAGVQGIADAVKKISTIDRVTCRIYAEEHFHKDRMVTDYEEVYKKLTK